DSRRGPGRDSVACASIRRAWAGVPASAQRPGTRRKGGVQSQINRRSCRRSPIDHLAELLGAEDFAGVQAAVDPEQGLSFLRPRARLRVAEAVDGAEAPRDFLVVRQLP